ncbi:ABC transporter ATP-binding protein [Sphaerisporangium siamense]|uniref:Molybdate transport system ATP-binding protein n=1 Tax=Sphaerisporangium siamense TaxID=795645 RepID=A0A7W7DC10_9ACTN|nr:ABC transporter ATP-binding protein [Sphaerisporangium siamense]MBB4704053.1 molybdate transport system ATP-binding protein [Sphaerisporangium siamense]GII82528.1 ABC transporter ATP-binding protein [Sphaerisporangium siamense]
MIEARLVGEWPRSRLDLTVVLAAGEVVGLLGPEGAGKTTVLRVLAGLAPAGGGYVLVDGAAVHARPPGRRSVAMAGRDPSLFPRLTVLDNVAFGPRCQGDSKEQARRAAAAWLDRMDLAGHARSLPRELSPGQARAVALARALAVRPRLLLLDEPLAGLDTAEADAVRTLLHDHLADFAGACLMATGDPLDVLVAADRLLVIEDGALAQEGTPAEVARRPGTHHAARLAGLNLCRGHATGRSVAVGGAGPFTVREALRGPVFVAFPPAAVTLSRSRPAGPPGNLWQGGVEGVERHGDRVRVRLGGPFAAVAELTPGVLAALAPSLGERMWATVPASETIAYPAPRSEPSGRSPARRGVSPAVTRRPDAGEVARG